MDVLSHLVADDEILALAGVGTIRENLNGKTVIPGLTDAHIHWEWTARALHQVNVFEVSNKAVAVERVAEWVAKTPAGQWVRGSGWCSRPLAGSRFSNCCRS